MVSEDIAAAFAVPGYIPPGITPEYLEESKDQGAIVGILFVGSLTTVIVFLRCYGRVCLSKKFLFGLDDVLAVIGLFFYIAFITLAVILIKLGSGRHQEYITYVLPNHTINATEVLDFAGHMVYAIALFILRLSGLAFYRRIGYSHHQLMVSIRCGAVFMALVFATQMMLIVFHCLPVTALWPYAFQPEASEHKCLVWGVVYLVNSCLSLACDCGMFAIPGAIIGLLKEARKTKIKLSLILFPGVLVIIISTVRVYYVVKGGWLYDGSWYYDAQLALESAEIGGTLAALSVPGLKPLFSHPLLASVFPRSRWPKLHVSRPPSASARPAFSASIGTIVTIGSRGKAGRRDSPTSSRAGGTFGSRSRIVDTVAEEDLMELETVPRGGARDART